MPKLSDATGLRIGAATVQKLYRGTTLLWTTPTVPAAPSSWAQTSEVAALTDEWTTIDDAAGQWTLTSVAAGVHSGTKGLALVGASSASPAALTKTGLNFAGTSWSYIFYMKVVTLNITAFELPFVDVSDATGVILRFKIKSNRQISMERLKPGFAVIAAAGTGTVVTANTWYKIEMRATGIGSTSGTATLLWNDTVLGTATGIDMTTGFKPDRVTVGFSSAFTGTVYIDDGLVTAS